MLAIPESGFSLLSDVVQLKVGVLSEYQVVEEVWEVEVNVSTVGT